jgi:L-amino acid N-acyltransferase YncA
MAFTTRVATADDVAALARIYNEGIEDRVATFQTEPRAADDMHRWFDGPYPLVVAEDGSGDVVAWASAQPYRPGRAWYSGIAEFSIYVARASRGRGAGRATLVALIEAYESHGGWKLLSRIFPENEASLALCRSLGFREVGVYRRHGKLDGEWRDCVVVELLLGEAARDPGSEPGSEPPSEPGSRGASEPGA